MDNWEGMVEHAIATMEKYGEDPRCVYMNRKTWEKIGCPETYESIGNISVPIIPIGHPNELVSFYVCPKRW